MEQSLLIAGDLNADPCVMPCLAKGTSSGRFVDLALAHSLGASKEPDAACSFEMDDCAGTRRDFVVACPNALAASADRQVTGRWFSLHFSIFAVFNIRQWGAGVACPCASQPIWPACWEDTADRSLPPPLSFRIFGTLKGRIWVLFLWILS